MYTHDTMNPCKQSTDLNEIITARQKKLQTSKAASLCAKHLSAVGRERMKGCGEWLWMLENYDGTKKKLEKGFFCGNRFCPACAWRYSAGWARALIAIDKYLTEEKQLTPILVTLTIPNVYGDQLNDALRSMAAAWDRMIRRSRYRAWKSFARKTEVTYNAAAGTYHPHYHVLVWVDHDYFTNGYIHQKTLLADWRAATGDPTITQVHVARCYDQGKKKSAVAEVAKYVAKASDYLENQDVFDGFYDGLHGARIITLGGEARKALRLYRDGALLDITPEQFMELKEFTIRAIYHWANESYNLASVEEIDLTDEAAQREKARVLIAEDMQAMAQGGYKRLGDLVESPWDETEVG